jgi:pimeloyl-ACP methyl ester carboxylesterase/outer membrane protein assembly factor BamB
MNKSKRFLLLTVFALSSLVMLLASSARAWEVSISDCQGCGSRGEAVVVDAAGDIIATGTFFYGSDVVKLSGSTGKLIWRYEVMGHESRNYAQDMAIDSHGDVFVVFANTRVMAKVSGATGKRIWDKPIDGTLNACQSYISAVTIDHEDNVLTAGTIGCRFNVSKLDGRTGDMKWHYEREGYAKAVAVDPSGNVAAAGLMNSNFGVVKLRAVDGVEIWQREINGAGNFTGVFEEANAVAMDKDGSVVAAGVTSNEIANFRDFTVAKYLPDGRIQWVEIIDGKYILESDRGERFNQSNDIAYALAIDKNGDVFAAGSIQEDKDVPASKTPSPEHFCVVKIARDGGVIWNEPAEEPPLNKEHISGHAFALSVNAAGNVVAGGVHDGRFTLVKFWGRTGGRAWRRQIASGSDVSSNGNSALGVVMDAASDVVAVGETIGTDGFSKFTVVKLKRKDGTDYGDAPPPPFPTPNPALTPVIFIPGIAGSRLNSLDNGSELWPGVGTFHKDLSLDPTSGGDYRPQVNPSDVIREQTIINPPFLGGRAYSFYQPLFDSFRREGYVEDGARPTLFVFPYDWRKSNAVNATLLRNKIIEIRERYPNSKVNIVTHSMGGLLARRYILDNPAPELHHVDNLITIAAPWLGAPKAVNAMETGEFLDSPASLMILKSTLRKLIEFFPGAHELLPSKAYFDFGGQPFKENGWNINGNNDSFEVYRYNQLYDFINGDDGDLNQRLQRSKPYRANENFHHRDGQDDWRNKGFGVTYYHLYGWKPQSKTIYQVITKRSLLCLPNAPRLCISRYVFDLEFGPGDGTVPILSATRKAAGQDYNAENSTLTLFVGDKTEHLELTQNPAVHQKIASILNSSSPSLAEKLNQKENKNRLTQTDEPITQQSYYFRVEGVASVTLTDEAGNATYPLNDAPDAGVPEVTSHRLAADSFLSIMPTDDSYTLTFVTGESPVAIDLTKGTDVETAQAIRYVDLNLPANTAVRLEITPEGVDTLRYDSNGDGTFDTTITPTVSVSGSAAQDTEPPSITFNEAVQPTASMVSLNATDSGAGVRSLFYSLDGAHFQPYVGTLSLNPRQTPVISAFAEDKLANRSVLITYTLTLPTVSINGVVTDATGNRISGATITMTGSQTATTTTDENGSYLFSSLPAGGNYTVGASKTNYVFTPVSQSFTNLSGNQTANFAALPGPILLTEENSTRAIALDSVTFWRDPFSLFTRYNFSSDQRTRITLFAVNVNLAPGESDSVITAQAVDSQHRIFPLIVESVGKVPNFDWLTQITVRLPDGLAGDISVDINLRGVASNKALINIKP